MLLRVIIPLIFHFKACTAGYDGETYAHLRLTRDMLDGNHYDKRVRPVRNASTAVTVTMRFNLYQLVDVEEPQQNVVLFMWVTQMWNDDFLGWTSAQYEGINWTVVPYEDIWLPDTHLYNSVKMEREASERYISAVVTTNETNKQQPVANMRFMYPSLYRFTCKLNVLFFPFDKQNCTLLFGSWTNDKSGIDYVSENDHVLTEGYLSNEEWAVESFNIVRHETYYNCCVHPYVMLSLHLVMQRKPLYYMINFIIPTAIITIVAITGFFTPSSSNAERAEKVNLGITTLLAMSILLLMVSDQMPTTSDFIPLIGWFYIGIILIISFGTFLTSLIIEVQGNGRKGKPVPELWRKLFFDILAKLVLMPPPKDLTNAWKKGHCRGGAKDLKQQDDVSVGGFPLNSSPITRVLADQVPLVSLAKRMGNGSASGSGGTSRAPPLTTKQTSCPEHSRVSFDLSADKLVHDTPPIAEEPDGDDEPKMSAAAESVARRLLKNRAATVTGGGSRKPSVMDRERVLAAQKSAVHLEWVYVAALLDRCLLIAFQLVVGSITIAMCIATRIYWFEDGVASVRNY